MLTFEDIEINRGFWLSRLEGAERLREHVVRDTTAYRLIYGESDLLPSLILDRYNDCFVIQTLSQGMDALKQMWIELIAERYSPRAIVERNEARVRDLEGLPRATGVVYGSDPGEFVIEESGVKLNVNLVEGQKTGSFPRSTREPGGGGSLFTRASARLFYLSGRIRAPHGPRSRAGDRR
jgi:23S rRNA (cytosine1962-C5)-methyltransferase